MKKVSQEQISSFVKHQFGRGSKVVEKLDPDTLLVQTAGGSYQRIKSNDVYKHSLGSANRDRHQETMDLRKEVKQSISDEYKAKAQERAEKNQKMQEEFRAKRYPDVLEAKKNGIQ